MADYYRKVFQERWNDLMDLGPNAQRVYFYAFTGPQSTGVCLCNLHLRRTARDLAMTATEVHGALVELQTASVAIVSSLDETRTVIADPFAAAGLCPKLANHKRGWARLAEGIPECEAQDAWRMAVPIDFAQLPEHTGGKLSCMDHESTPMDQKNGKGNGKAKSTSTTDPKTKRFIKPSSDVIGAYFVERGGQHADGEVFFDFYESNGWRVGRSPMKDWKSTVRNWIRRNKSTPGMTIGMDGRPHDSNGDLSPYR